MKSALYKTGQQSIPDGAFSSAVAVHAASRRWGNFSAMAEHMDIGDWWFARTKLQRAGALQDASR